MARQHTPGEAHILICGDPAMATSTLLRQPLAVEPGQEQEDLHDADLSADAILNELS